MSLVQIISSSRARRIATWTLAALGGIWLFARFFHLGTTPPGFWMDEAWDAVQAICLAETGHDANGRRWPLFSSSLDGGSVPITWSVFDAAWTRAFGTSMAAFRAAAGFWIVVSCLALFGVARGASRIVAQSRSPTEPAGSPGDPDLAAGRTFPYLVLFAALLSPWSFQFSRIAWEGPLAPAFLVLALWAVTRLRVSRGRAWPLWSIAGGASTALSMISYPPLRLATPLILTLALSLIVGALPPGKARWRFVLRMTPGLVVFALLIAPVVAMTLSGEITSRTMSVAIFAPDWLDKNRGTMGRMPFFFVTLLDNLFAHLRPSYLFFSGDANTRHSAQIVGQLSPVDILAVVVAAVMTIRLFCLAIRQARGRGAPAVLWPRLGSTGELLALVAAFAILAGFFATLPAALTWENVPHALRSIGAWPFVALFTGAMLALGWSRRPWLPVVTVVVALAYTLWYLPAFFTVYREVDPNVFHRDISEAIAAGQAAKPPRSARESLQPLAPRYIDEILRYFLMHYDHLSCQASAEALQEMRKPH